VNQPGTRLRGLAARVCSEKTMERLIDPVIGDLQVEYAVAIGRGRRGLALLTGYVAFAKVAAWCGVLGLREARRNWSTADRQGLLRTLWLSACAIVIVSVPLWLLELPRTSDMVAEFAPKASIQRLMIYLVPAILPLSVPAGLAIGAAMSTHGRPLSRRLIVAIMLVAIGVSATSLFTLGWITPVTNQSYRETLIGKTIPKGDRELTLIELRRSFAERDQEIARRAQFEFHSRLSWAFTPMTLAAFALVVSICRRPRLTKALGSIGVAAFGYYVAFWLANGFNRDGVLLPQLSAWLPQIALIAMTVVVAIPRTSIRTHA
jgi:lipopolysaccharide export LptBFGC system permease protein LptF